MIQKPGKPTPLNKALIRARRWCDRRTKDGPAGSYSLCWHAQTFLLESMAKEGLSIVKGKKVIAAPHPKKRKRAK